MPSMGATMRYRARSASRHSTSALAESRRAIAAGMSWRSPLARLAKFGINNSRRSNSCCVRSPASASTRATLALRRLARTASARSSASRSPLRTADFSRTGMLIIVPRTSVPTVTSPPGYATTRPSAVIAPNKDARTGVRIRDGGFGRAALRRDQLGRSPGGHVADGLPEQDHREQQADRGEQDPTQEHRPRHRIKPHWGSGSGGQLANRHRTVGDRADAVVVGHDQERPAFGPAKITEQGEHASPALGVEVAGRLVGRARITGAPAGQSPVRRRPAASGRPTDRAAGSRPAIAEARPPRGPGPASRVARRPRPALEVQRGAGVLGGRRQRREQVGLLEHKVRSSGGATTLS